MQHAAALLAELPEASYEHDVVLWAERQARLMREGRLQDLDLAHLIEEVEDVGKSYRDEIENRLAVLLTYLLEWKYRPGNRSGSRSGTLLEQRGRIARVVQRAPSLRAYPAEMFEECYLSARLAASRETGMDFALFPADPPFTLAEALDRAFFPVEPDREARA